MLKENYKDVKSGKLVNVMRPPVFAKWHLMEVMLPAPTDTGRDVPTLHDDYISKRSPCKKGFTISL